MSLTLPRLLSLEYIVTIHNSMAYHLPRFLSFNFLSNSLLHWPMMSATGDPSVIELRTSVPDTGATNKSFLSLCST